MTYFRFNTESYESVPAEDVAGIDFLTHVIERRIAAVGDDDAGLRLERRKVVHYTAAEENTESYESVPAEDVAGIDFLTHVIERRIAAVGDDDAGLRLERRKVVHYTAAEERALRLRVPARR